MADLAPEQTEELAEYQQVLRKWTELTEQVSLPPVIAAALATGRPSLLKIVKPPLGGYSEEESVAVTHAMAVLIETNMALQRHCREVAKLAEKSYPQIKGIAKTLRQIEQFANFRVDDEEDA